MLSTSQILILIAALFAAALISLLHFSLLLRNRRLNFSSEVLIYIVPLMFITLIGIEVIYFRYYLTFIFDFGWNAVLLSYTVMLLISLPLLKLFPGKKVFAFLKQPPPQVKVVTETVTKTAEETVKTEETVLIEEVKIEESAITAKQIESEEFTEPLAEAEKQSGEAVLLTEETAHLPETAVLTDSQAEIEEKKPEASKPKHPKARAKHSAKPKALPETQTKKPVVNKTRKKSP